VAETARGARGASEAAGAAKHDAPAQEAAGEAGPFDASLGDAAGAAIAFGPDGLVPAIVQDARDGAVLMLAWMDAEALRRTRATGRTWFWSRSRRSYWAKGETSGNRQLVREIRYDCDADALLLVVDQEGSGACHTGARSCFVGELPLWCSPLGELGERGGRAPSRRGPGR
jgi:phosphoribosyl-AMP cyclohydrolase